VFWFRWGSPGSEGLPVSMSDGVSLSACPRHQCRPWNAVRRGLRDVAAMNWALTSFCILVKFFFGNAQTCRCDIPGPQSMSRILEPLHQTVFEWRGKFPVKKAANFNSRPILTRTKKYFDKWLLPHLTQLLHRCNITLA